MSIGKVMSIIYGHLLDSWRLHVTSLSIRGEFFPFLQSFSKFERAMTPYFAHIEVIVPLSNLARYLPVPR